MERVSNDLLRRIAAAQGLRAQPGPRLRRDLQSLQVAQVEAHRSGGAVVAGIQVGPQLVPGDAGHGFDLEDAFGGDSMPELLNGLVTDAKRLPELPLAAGDADGSINWGVAHANQSTTDSCSRSTTDSCERVAQYATNGCERERQ